MTQFQQVSAGVPSWEGCSEEIPQGRADTPLRSDSANSLMKLPTARQGSLVHLIKSSQCAGIQMFLKG